ncbi:hypothetical protein FRC07_005554 [Ceratobasidium sp. 392]|nr:hypothetical protein FRC07_005554 [Ceratobasidium sp. 392]
MEEAYHQEQDEEPQPTSAPSPADKRGTWFRRAPPAASLPSSPRSSFSFSVRSGVDKANGGGWQDEDAPAVPPIPALYRQAQSGSSGSRSAPVTPSSHTTSFGTTPVNGTLRPDWTSRRKSAGKETIAAGSGVSALTAGGASSGGQSHLSGKTKHASTSGEEEGVVPHAALVRTANPAEMRPAVYASTPTSPQSQYAGDQRGALFKEPGRTLGRRTRTYLKGPCGTGGVSSNCSFRVSRIQMLGGGGSGTGGSEGAGGGIVGVREEDEDDLVYVRGEDVVPGNRGSSYVAPARESSCIGGRESSYVINGRDWTYLSSGHHSTYTGTGRDSTYPVAWAEPSSPNEMTPALGSPHASSPMIRGMTTMPATPGHSTPGAGPSTLSPPSPYFPGYTAPLDPKKAKRVPATSFVSSVFSRFSGHSSDYASVGHQTPNRTGTQQSEEVPPLPTPSPHVARMWEAYNRAGGGPSGSNVSAAHSTTVSSVVRREGNLELPALAQRAEKLNEMELGKLPHRVSNFDQAGQGGV